LEGCQVFSKPKKGENKMENNLPKTPAMALFVLSQTNMRNFTKGDWEAFAGCDSETPMIGETNINGEDVVVIADGSRLGFYNEFGFNTEFELSKI